MTIHLLKKIVLMTQELQSTSLIKKILDFSLQSCFHHNIICSNEDILTKFLLDIVFFVDELKIITKSSPNAEN